MSRENEKEAPDEFIVKNWNASAVSQERGVIRGQESARSKRVPITLVEKPPWEADDDD